MKLVHLQIFAAAMAVGLVGTGLGAMTIHSGKQESERKLAKAEADLKSIRNLGGPIGPAPKPRVGRDLEKENADLGKRIRTLEQRVGELERENAMLKEAIARNAAQPPPHQKPIPGSKSAVPEPIVVNAADRGVTSADPSVPPPPPVDANETWGSAEDSELDEIAAIVKMTPEQRDQTRTFIRAGQNRFLQALQQAGEAGEKDITIIERLGKQFYEETRGNIGGILRPDQRAAFEEYLRKQEELR